MWMGRGTGCSPLVVRSAVANISLPGPMIAMYLAYSRCHVSHIIQSQQCNSLVCDSAVPRQKEQGTRGHVRMGFVGSGAMCAAYCGRRWPAAAAGSGTGQDRAFGLPEGRGRTHGSPTSLLFVPLHQAIVYGRLLAWAQRKRE